MINIKRFFSRNKDAQPGDLTAVGTGMSWLKSNHQYPQLIQKAGPYSLVVLIALMMADLTAIAVRDQMIPKSAAPARRQNFDQAPFKSISDYNDILARNIFNSDGIIPDLQVGETNQIADLTGPARESQLPITLVGTIVHQNPGKSVATLQLKGSADKILPYIPNDDIEGIATLIKVERKKVFIRNLSSGALEYVEIKEDNAFTFQRKTVAQQDGPVMKEAEDTFAITRNDLETQMSNLPELLTQARAVPNMVGGRVDGFKIVEIQDNSIFKKLGIAQNDVIKAVDGESLDSPAKAMELYNALRNKTSVRIDIERNGRTSTLNYNIR